MRCKKCQTEFEDKDLQTTWYDNGVVFRLVCHSLECDYYYETQISGAATMYKTANGSADSKKDVLIRDESNAFIKEEER